MFTTPAASSVLAVVTTVHLGLAALRHHRHTAMVNVLAAVSLLFCALPWLLPTPFGLAVGVALHAAWFLACEAFASPRATRGSGAELATRARESATVAGHAVSASAGKHFVPATVLAVVDETPAVRTIRLARPDGFEFIPGQFITVRVRLDGRDHARCYSLSSAPEACGYLEISVRQQGLVSNALHTAVRVGSTLSIKGPLGAFRFPVGDDRPIVFLAGGIGITPLMSMVRHMVVAQPTRPATLLYSAREEADLAFRDELASIARRHPQIHIHLAVSGGKGGPGLYSGRIDESLLRATVPHLSHSLSFICGPAPMIDAMKALLSSMGVPPGQVHAELFEAAIAASAEGPLRPRTAAGGPRGATYGMTCARQGLEVPIAAGQTLLEAAEAAGVPIESLCRAGVCGTCRVRVASGNVACASETLDVEDQERGFVLACVSTAAGDCTVEL